jgi:tRNA-Thr(GGU) m(6)t(6)A37 methyltransferase TsaA
MFDEGIRSIAIGVIHSEHNDPQNTPIQPVFAKECIGRVEIFDSFLPGIQDLDEFSHLYLIYHFHRQESIRLVTKPFLQDVDHGIYATRAPCRPNKIGLSIVELLRCEGGILHIKGVDVLNGTPLLDIKPYISKFDHVSGSRHGWYESVSEEDAQLRGKRGYRKS